MLNANAVFCKGFNAGIKPDPDMFVSDWADNHRRLPQKGSPEPGKWQTSRTPYLKEIMECISPSSPIERIIFMKGSQVGGTEAGLNLIGFIIHRAPGPVLVVQPTGDTAKAWSKQRLSAMIEASPSLQGIVRDSRERDSGNTTLSKEFPGGILIIASAKSTARLRSMPVRYLFLDEVDEYDGEIGGQGDPVSLAEKRTSNFAMRKIYLCSTPTFKSHSRIEREYELSDKRRYYIPCPHCNEKQVLKWEGIKWDKDGDKHLPDTAAYCCMYCGAIIPEHHKTWMLENGEWVAESPGDGRVAGFHLSSLYSPIGWRSWADTVREFLGARKRQKEGDHAPMETWINTVLGETWEDTVEQFDYEILYNRCEQYGDKVPMGAAILTAGCDVQKDRIEVEVVAWGRDEESWSIIYRIFLGDTAKIDVWRELDGFLQETYEHEGGIRLRLSAVCVDTGYNTKQVYDFVRERQIRNIFAIKGSNQAGVPIISDRPPKRQKMSKVHLFLVGTESAKQSIYGRLKVEEPGPGYMHFPESYNVEYFRQLTSERLVYRKGKRVWELIAGKRNESLDCRVYSLAALEILKGFSNFNLNRRVDVLSGQAKAIPKEGSSSAPQSETAQKINRGRRIISKGYTDPYRR
ncbi:MAG: hypothetical protein A2W23_08660 [Planctomycetes bacterium RBG_16_43_13]|nr:MAG: hypothetical protein A2W23_08660 [Planctomycetes bacterium RBG_16_43_13]